MNLQGKTIILGICGSIAAYKAADIASQLVKLNAEVHVVMTESATRLITPITLQTLSRHPVGVSLWEEKADWHPGHIDIADRADLLLVAPATANTIARFSHGFADDLLSCIYLATRAKVVMAPAMNGKMYQHPATMDNLKILKGRGVEFVEPVSGMLACGYAGEGKLASPEAIVQTVCRLLVPSQEE